MEGFKLFLLVMVAICISVAVKATPIPSTDATLLQETIPSVSNPRLRAVGTRGFHDVAAPFAEFDAQHLSVDIWTPSDKPNAPVMVYAHGGAGYREDDRARVEMFRRHGFATISFDAYEMNGFHDWEFVTRRIVNSGKQKMIWGVFKGAVDYASTQSVWDNENIILYGGSNGGRVVLYAGSEISLPAIRAIISEAPAGSGFELGDYAIPTIVPFGALDTWAGRSEADFVWKRKYPSSTMSTEEWVNSQQSKGRPVEFIFYENAGHLLFAGPLEKVTVRRGKNLSFTAFQGAAEGVLEEYKHDVISFAKRHLSKK